MALNKAEGARKSSPPPNLYKKKTPKTAKNTF